MFFPASIEIPISNGLALHSDSIQKKSAVAKKIIIILNTTYKDIFIF